MLLQNLDPPALTTELVAKKMQNNLIECIILTGPRSGHSVSIPKIPLCPSDTPMWLETAVSASCYQKDLVNQNAILVIVHHI